MQICKLKIKRRSLNDNTLIKDEQYKDVQWTETNADDVMRPCAATHGRGRSG